MYRRRRRSRHWHDPEVLVGQAERDSALGRDRFYVYVLDTAGGYYVGHTWSVSARLRQHRAGQVPSTAGLGPTLLWQSRPFSMRSEAARFEAALKSLRDRRAPRFREVVGVDPVPFVSAARPVRSGPPRWIWPVLAGFVIPFLLLTIVAQCA